ncbi:MAG TPA: hypothetical protein VER96_10405 [Polyangiaceae bacterium]|nr:hypothetical protein [Polyangiaceae bacterium]
MRSCFSIRQLAALSGLWSLLACGHSSNSAAPGTSGGSPAAVAESGGVSGANSGGNSSGGGRAGANSGGVSAAFGGAGNVSGHDGGATASLGGASGASSANSASGTGGASATGGSAATACPTLPATPIPANGIIQFNDNGGWNWFQDERAVVDRAKNRFVIGSVASGGARDGDIEAVVYDVGTGTKQLFTLGTGLKATPDDRNAPTFLVRPDGKYFAMWTGNRIDCDSRSSIFDGAAWSTEALFDWSSLGCPWGTGTVLNRVVYANPWYLGGSIFAAVRSVDTIPTFLRSDDGGVTQSYYGRLVAAPFLGFVGGYYKYWGNNSDRIDFVGTEGHPRDIDASLWHGYLKAGKLYDSKDTVLDDNVTDSDAPAIKSYTPAVATGVTLGGVTLNHLWNHDIVRYADGTIAILGQGHVGSNMTDPDLRLIYARYDGSAWRSSYLAKAGHKLTVDDQDYTGLSALHPDNPNIIFISTNVDPRDDSTPLAKHEIFEGVTCDGGATWRWAPLTQGSTVDNLRPIVPKWDASHTLLLWLSGTYTTAQQYSLTVVGTTTL